MGLSSKYCRIILLAGGALTAALNAAGMAQAQSAPPALTPGSPGPVIVGPSGQPYTQNIGNGTQQLRATVASSERDLNIAFTRLIDVDPNFYPLAVRSNNNGLLNVGTVTARYGFEVGSAGAAPQQENSTTDVFGGSSAFRLFETSVVTAVNVGGGITANIRAGGVQRASATASSAAAAQSAALGQIGVLELPGRRLPAVVTSTGVTESTSETRVSAITARDSYVVTIVTFGPAPILVGRQGQCSQFLTNCQGGLTYQIGDDETNFNTYHLEDVYVTHTVNRTTTASGTITLDIPFAAYGRAHPAAQTMAFDLSERFLARMLRGDDARWGVGGGKVGLFLEVTAAEQDYRASGVIAASHGSSTGLRGGIVLRVSPDLTLGLAGEGGRGRWTLNDLVLPESTRDHLWRIGGFAAWSPGPWRITAGVFGGRQTVTSSASSALGGGTSAARYTASTWGAGIAIGHAIPVGVFTLTPSLGTDWLGWRAPAFIETGGGAPLSVAASARDQWRSHVGLAADYRGAKVGIGAFARGTLVSGDRQGLVSASDGVTSGGGSFTIGGPASDRHSVEMGGHVDYAVTASAVIYASGNARIGSAGSEFGGQVGIRIGL